MISIKLSQKEKIKHLIYWLIITAFLCVVDPVPANLFVQIVSTLIIMLVYMFVYYAQCLYIFPAFYKKHTLKLTLSILSILILYFAINYSNLNYVVTLFGNANPVLSESKFTLISDYLILFAIVSVVAFGSFQNKMSILKIQLQSEKEKALLIKELGFFKNQFNSHITFNFLNYCYNYVHESSKEAAEAIELFSGMLRYTINSKPNELVLIEKEVEYINQFINLKKQLSKGMYIEFRSDGDLSNTYIFPRMLITFVENAFKHGKTHEESNPISISLNAIADQVTFEVKNKKNKSKTPLSTGIGQNNVKNQLELYYKNRHDLKIAEDDDNYACKLVLTN